MLPSLSVAARIALAATAVAALATTSACTAPDGEDEDVEDGVAAALTVENGDRFVASVTGSEVVLRKSVAGSSLRFAAHDFEGKSILVHPIPGKTELGVYAHVEAVDDRGDTLAITTAPLSFDEMEATRGADVIRLYRNTSLPVAKGSTAPTGGTRLLEPTDDGAGIHPLGFSGPLSSDIHEEIWVGKEQTTRGLRVKVEAAKLRFDPRATLDYTRGKGLAFGIRGELAADVAVRVTGPASGRYSVFKSPVLSSPRTTFIVPMGIPPAMVPVPVVVGVDTYLECSALGEADLDGRFESHVSVTMAASARVHPGLRRPLEDWVEPGPWPSTVTATASAGAPGATITGAGISCAVPRVDFPITIAGIVGPFLGVEPAVAATTRGFQRSVDVYAGAASELTDTRFVSFRLARWSP